MNTELLPLHMGALHAYEQVLVVVLAFGPFVLLGVVAFFLRRRDAREASAESDAREALDESAESAESAASAAPDEPAQPSKKG